MPEETRRILIQFGIYLGIMIFSYVFALIEVNMRAKKKVNAAEEKLKAAQAAQAAAEEQLKAVQVILQTKETETSLLRLWIDASRTAQLELDGLEVDPQNLSPDQRRRLIALLTHMRPWLEGSAAAGPAPAHPYAAASQVAPAPVASRPSAAATAAPAPAEEESGPLSLAGQIDRILQARLQGTPLASLGIRIRDLLSGGVEFVVAGKPFNTVDEIPDPQVQAVIRAAIKEWEHKTG